jgi:carbon-monoxide dehydrogenase large subunit
MATAETASTPRSVGASVKRREDPRLLTGHGHFVDDVQLPGMLHVAFVRSTHAHARLTGIDREAARAVPGVIAVITAEDIADTVKPIRALTSAPSYQASNVPVLAHDKVRTVGEAIAMVVAESRYAAEDGADAVHVAYDPLPPILTIEQALADGAAAIQDEVPDNLFNHFEAEEGDVDAAFADAAHTVELDVTQQRYCAAPMEARAVVASYTVEGDELTVWLSSQVPHLIRTGLSRFLGVPETQVRVISPDVGGGFGPKCLLYPEDVALAAGSRLLRRPLKWISDRVEDLQTTVHGRESLCRIRAAATRDGRLTGVQADLYAANGAYAPWPFTAMLDSGQASENVPGPYDFPSYRRHVHAVVTNKTPMGPYRGVGRVIACFAIERVMDELAARLGIDPLEVRRRNVARSMPHTTAAGLRLESGDYPRMLDMLEEAVRWKAVRADNLRMREEDGRIRGLGLAFAVEHSSYGPKALGSRGMDIVPGYDSSTVRVEPDGRVRVAVGLHSHGQGQETTMAQIAADELGVPAGTIDVVYGDTAIVPYGMGTWASRSTVYCGGATILAAGDVRAKALELAADMLEASAEDLEVQDGTISVRGTPSARVAFADVAYRALHQPHLLPEGMEPGLESTRRYSAPDPGSFSAAVHAAHVEVDRETGAVAILGYWVVEDCGRMVNPMIVDGQVHGGVAQGIGGALLEELVYDAAGVLVSGSFMDYLLPTALEVPEIDIRHLESPSPHTLGGFKGMGEGGAINAPVAVVSAVNDALAPFGIVANHTPLTPEWVHGELRRARP